MSKVVSMPARGLDKNTGEARAGLEANSAINVQFLVVATTATATRVAIWTEEKFPSNQHKVALFVSDTEGCNRQPLSTCES